MARVSTLGLYGGPQAAIGVYDTTTALVVDFALRLDGVDVPIIPGGHEMSLVPLAPSTRAPGGQLRSATTTTRPRVRDWTFRTPPIDWADGVAIEAVLNQAGRRTATGYLVGGGSIQVYILGVQRDPTSTLQDMSLSFRMLKAEA